MLKIGHGRKYRECRRVGVTGRNVNDDPTLSRSHCDDRDSNGNSTSSDVDVTSGPVNFLLLVTSVIFGSYPFIYSMRKFLGIFRFKS